MIDLLKFTRNHILRDFLYKYRDCQLFKRNVC